MNKTVEPGSRNKERGATVVEFAVVAALLLLVVFGILEFSLVFLQQHFVANAAREGLRIGTRANNYNCFDAADTSTGCQNTLAANRVYRSGTIVTQLTNCAAGGYLCTIYQNAITAGQVTVLPVANPIDTNRKSLTVTVTTPNFLPPLVLAALVPGYTHPTVITYSATGDYEDAQEP